VVLMPVGLLPFALRCFSYSVIASSTVHPGGSRFPFLAAEALNEYLDVNEWQVGGVKRAITSLDRGEGVSHKEVRGWVNSWDRKHEQPAPKRSAR
jgi:predicted transcriptional regulator